MIIYKVGVSFSEGKCENEENVRVSKLMLFVYVILFNFKVFSRL